MPTNRQIILDNRPAGEATESNFKLRTAQTPELQDGQVLVRNHYLSLDPYMRGRMNDGKSYAQPQELGQVMGGGTAGEVVGSLSPNYAIGDKVTGMGGWQEYSVFDAGKPGQLRKVDTTHVPLSHYLGAVGMPGVTAWYGLVRICAPKAGETVVCSAATGAVGSAFMPPRSWGTTPASTTSCMRMRHRCPKPSSRPVRTESTATSRTSAAWCSTRSCRA